MVSSSPDVALSKVDGPYPTVPPFDPDEKYPEYCGNVCSNAPNPVYRAVRETFRLLQYDRNHYGSPDWNPLECLIKPGDRVFIKPNLVAHEYGRKAEQKTGDLFSVITHPSVVRAVADYAAIALRGKGSLTIGDNPSIDADFSKLLTATRLDIFEELYPKVFGISCSILDLREQWCSDLKNYGYGSKMEKLPGDSLGCTTVNLGEKSYFYGINPLLFRGVFNNRWDTIKHHHGKTQEYSISNSIYQSDVYISIPKLKTHHKVGTTLNIKGLVGICANKNYLIHWRIGFPSWGGDEFPDTGKWLDHVRLFVKHVLLLVTPDTVSQYFAQRVKGTFLDKVFRNLPYRGAWEGNDSCWRMAADLHHALASRPRKYFSVIDGVTAGEKNGPFCPAAKESRVILAGNHLVKTDCVAARLMDFRIDSIKYLPALVRDLNLDLRQIQVVSEDWEVADLFQAEGRKYFGFEPPTGWYHLSTKGNS